MFEGDFPSGILDQRDHRPFPIPDSPWVMTQSWHDLLFAHWPIDVRQVASKLPAGFEPDLFDSQAWLAVTPFHLTNVSARLVPALPYVSAFPELNVRTYVRVAGTPGVYFFSLDAGNQLAVTAARTMFHLPYHRASMRVEEREGRFHYTSRRTDDSSATAEWTAEYWPSGDPAISGRGSLEYFLTERYCLFTVDEDFKAFRVDIHHGPWVLHPAEARITVNTMAEAAGIAIPSIAPMLHYSRRQDVVVWAPQNA